MPYSMDNVPQWAKKKSKSVQKTAIDVFNATFKDTGSEEKARIASLAAMKNKEESLKKSRLISKSLSNDKRIATFIVLEPQEDDGLTSDLHTDWYDADTVEEACRNFNKSLKESDKSKANLLHYCFTDGYEFIESYILPADIELNGDTIKKGTWIATIEVSPDEEHQWIWEGIKNGKFDGLSIQAMGVVESITV